MRVRKVKNDNSTKDNGRLRVIAEGYGAGDYHTEEVDMIDCPNSFRTLMLATRLLVNVETMEDSDFDRVINNYVKVNYDENVATKINDHFEDLFFEFFMNDKYDNKCTDLVQLTLIDKDGLFIIGYYDTELIEAIKDELRKIESKNNFDESIMA